MDSLLSGKLLLKPLGAFGQPRLLSQSPLSYEHAPTHGHPADRAPQGTPRCLSITKHDTYILRRLGRECTIGST